MEIVKNIFSWKVPKFIKDSVWTFVGMLIVGFSGLVLQTIINGYYSSDSLGIYVQTTSFYTLFAAISAMGLDTSLVKSISEHSNNINHCKRILSAALVLVLISSSIVLGLFFLLKKWNVSIFSSQLIENAFGYIVWAVPLFAVNKMFISALNALRLMKGYSFIRSIRWILVLSFTFVFTLLGKELPYSLLAYVFAELILLLYFVFAKFRGWICFDRLIYWMRKHLSYGVYGLFMSVISEINTNVLVIISGYFLSLSEIALIGFVMSFIKAITMMVTTIQINFNPLFAQKSSLNLKTEIEKKMSKIYKVTMLTSFPLLLLVLGVYQIYVIGFMGPDFANTIKYFLIVAIGAILVYIFQWNTTMLLLSRQFKCEIFRMMSVSLLKFFVTYIFTKHWGMIGNLWAYTAVELYSVCINIL